MISPRLHGRRASSGFTLIELLTVIAIIGILTAITIPTVGRVRDNAKKTKVRIQFTQWSAGVRLFKQVYGYYPRFEGTTVASRHKVNGALDFDDTSINDADYLFRELLSGKGAKPASGGGFDFASSEKDGSSTIQNRKRQQFVTFDISEVTSRTGTDSGDVDIKVDGAVKDAFGNVEIAVLVDRNGDGLISTADLSSGVTDFPALTAKGNNGTLASTAIKAKIDAADASGNGVRADVIFYSPGRGSGSSTRPVSESDAVWSW